jgi:uncharacterized protein YkwD
VRFLVAALGLLSIAASHYGGPVEAIATSAIETRIVTLIGEVAHNERRETPRLDARLQRAATEIARRMPQNGRPSNELVQAAMWLHGLVEPPPHLVALDMPQGGEQATIDELRVQLPRALSEGRYKTCAVAAVPSGGVTVIVIALAESWIELEPIPRALPSGGPTPLRGRLLPPFNHPDAVVTAPDGKVSRLSLEGDATRFSGTFRCGPEKGRYQVEVNGDGQFGPAVLANFPVQCGSAASNELVLPARKPNGQGERFADGNDAETQLLALLNSDRVRAGLPPLASDARLVQVARAHSADMRARGFVGHVSPTTGSAADRIKRANVTAQLVLENVARAYSPAEAQRGLMDSPGHRANILNRDATHVGIGVAISDGVGGVKELLVTQLYIKPFDTVGPASKPELRRAIAQLRQKRGLPPLDADGALDEVSQSTAEDLAKGTLTRERAGEPMERALGKLANKYRQVRSVVAVVGGLGQVPASLEQPLSDATANALGLGLASSSGGLHVVLVLATRRAK